MAATLSVWFASAFGISVLGGFESENRPPVPLGAAALVPVFTFALWHFKSDALRRIVLTADLRLLTLAQTWRVGGLLFVILYAQGVLPGQFALPAGLGDFAIGATAPFVARALAKPHASKSLFVWWNVLGIMDLVLAVTLGILSSASSVDILAGEVTTEVMGMFPLSLIPTFFVPLLILLHVVALIQVGNRRSRRWSRSLTERMGLENRQAA
jgi:hypothetical protein